MEKALCNVVEGCSKPAYRAERDIKEVYTDDPWAHFEYCGKWRYGCEDHYHLVRPSKTYRLNDNNYPFEKIG